MKRTTLSKLLALPLIALPFAILSHSVSAQESPVSDTHLVLTLGIGTGGDKLAEVEYDHGDDGDVRAGGLILAGVGINHQFGNNWELQATLNYLFDGADADNGDVSFARWPIDVLAFYRTGNHRFGGGLTYHMNPKFDIDIDYYVDDSIDFDDALGFVVEYDYFFTNNFSVGVRGTLIDYEASDYSDEISGNSIGVVANGYFF
jgi:hypothetical protein